MYCSPAAAIVVVSVGDFVYAGTSFDGPVLLGTAADEVCSLEGRMYSFTMTETAFKADVHSEYDWFNISLQDVMELYGRVGPPFHGQPNVSCGCGSPQLAPEVCIPCKHPSKPAYSPWWWSVVERGSDFGFHCTSRAFAAVHSKKQPVFLHSYKIMEEQFPGLFCAAHCTEKAIYSFTGPLQPDTETDRGRLIEIASRYLLSFYKHGDPNAERDKGAPEWPEYSAAGQNVAFALPDAGGVYVEQNYRQQECDYWETLPDGPDQ